jgi:hypothetical protein
MQRRVLVLIVGLFLLQLSTGCCRWRNYRQQMRHANDCSCSLSAPSCSSCESSPLSAATLGSPTVIPMTPTLHGPAIGPPSLEAPVKMPNLSSRPIVGPIGLRR